MGQSSRSHEAEDSFGGLAGASLSTPLDRVGFTEFNIKAMYIATTRFDVTGVPTGDEVDVQHETVSCNIKVFTCTSRSIS